MSISADAAFAVRAGRQKQPILGRTTPSGIITRIAYIAVIWTSVLLIEPEQALSAPALASDDDFGQDDGCRS